MKNILIIGGDKRSVYLSDLFEKHEYKVRKSFLLNDSNNVQENIKQSEIIIVPMPASTDNIHIYTPLSDEDFEISELVNLTKGKVVIGGKLSADFIRMLENNNNKVFDLMSNRELVEKNIIPTVEGIIKILIEKTNFTLFDSKVAVLGFGRIGKRTANILKSLGAVISCYDIKKEEVANIRTCGYNVIGDISSDLGKFDIIINTIPEKIINKEELDIISKNAFLLDVASNPGGFDYEYAESIGLNITHALGIPGKIAPKTSAKYMKDLIEKLII